MQPSTLSTRKASKSLNNIGSLHIIRGLAAFLVTVAHAKWPFWIGGTAYLEQKSIGDQSLLEKIGFVLAMLTSNGTAMVIIFYVLSGFLISYSYEKNNWRYKEFLINRSMRIYIPFAASVLLAWLMIVAAFQLNASVFETNTDDFSTGVKVAYHEGLTFSNFIKTFLFYRSGTNYFGFNFVYWSLLYEAVFYLLFPLLFRYLKVVSIFSVAVFPLHFFISLPEMPYFLFYFLSKYLIYFCMGAILYKYVSRPELNWKKLNRLIVLLALVALFTLLVFSGLFFSKKLSFLFAGLLGVTAIYYVITFSIKDSKLTRCLIGLGEVSYSMYLIHIPLFIFFYAATNYLFGLNNYESPWIHYIFVLAVIPVAYLFYQLFEKRSLVLIKRFKEKRALRSAPAQQHFTVMASITENEKA